MWPMSRVRSSSGEVYGNILILRFHGILKSYVWIVKWTFSLSLFSVFVVCRRSGEKKPVRTSTFSTYSVIWVRHSIATARFEVAATVESVTQRRRRYYPCGAVRKGSHRERLDGRLNSCQSAVTCAFPATQGSAFRKDSASASAKDERLPARERKQAVRCNVFPGICFPVNKETPPRELPPCRPITCVQNCEY